eukprot:TRINITY_DN42250_c0_g1_i1.p1 TRINITY_DN42250_c0_g1~~TRINITY_DN42250_c0_g1_i1.p1  ORF type:complete len:681 (+),score=100.06 TRINITY_DN42250_c0_g1_i1:248-2290(+)
MKRGSTHLSLPQSDEVRQHVDSGGSTVTFLEVAIGIIDKLETCLPRSREDELRFLRDCLNAGHEKTHLPCLLFNDSDQECASLSPKSKQNKKNLRKTMTAIHLGSEHRKDHQLRGSLRSLVDGPLHGAMASKGLPWMGPEVPDPCASLVPETAAKVGRHFQEDFNSWSFDMISLAKLVEEKPLRLVGPEAIQRNGGFSEFHLDGQKLQNFFQELEALYVSAPVVTYHTSVHAADVLQTVHGLISEGGLSVYYDPMDCLGSLLAAAVHDVAHDGFSNAFHVAVQDEIALTYNDRSPLENFHLAIAFKLMRSKLELDILGDLLPEQAAMVRLEMIEMVLGTDMSEHFSKLGEFTAWAGSFGENRSTWQANDKAMGVMRANVLHCADISNPGKVFSLCQTWCIRIITEMFKMGDQEKRLGLPISPLCDRRTTQVSQSQIGFIDFIVMPCFQAVGAIFPATSALVMENLNRNRSAWQYCKEMPGCLCSEQDDGEPVESVNMTKAARIMKGGALNEEVEDTSERSVLTEKEKVPVVRKRSVAKKKERRKVRVDEAVEQGAPSPGTPASSFDSSIDLKRSTVKKKAANVEESDTGTVLSEGVVPTAPVASSKISRLASDESDDRSLVSSLGPEKPQSVARISSSKRRTGAAAVQAAAIMDGPGNDMSPTTSNNSRSKRLVKIASAA